MKIALSSETTIDLPKSLLEKYNIKTVPFSLLLGNESKFDGEISTDEIIEFVNKTKILPKTGAVNQIQYEEHFSSILKEYDGIIHISTSSEVSSAYNNAVIASKSFKNVYVIDSKSLSTGIALISIYARKLIDNGLDIQEIVEKCKARIPYVQVSFELNRLDYLYKGGRCSMLSLLGANLLKIRPQILVREGKMISGKKYRGSFDNVCKNYVKDTLEMFDNPDLENVFITYTTADNEILDYIAEVLKERGFQNIMITRAGGTITSHCGENCLGILYVNDGNKEIKS